MPDIETTPITSWQFFLACKRALGMGVMNKIYAGVKARKCPHCKEPITEDRTRQLNRWSADPRYTASSQPNPLDRLLDLEDRLMDLGKEEIARGAVDLQARVVGCVLRELSPTSDKKTIAEELLDNIPALAAYTEAAREDSGQPLAVIREKAQVLIREIEEDLAMIEQQRGKE